MSALSQKDIKLLWGRAANRCSSCRCELSFEPSGGTLPLGEQAHIVAEQSSGPRGNSSLTADERNSYPNLILLCPTCHTKIDKAPGDYPIERLHLIKTQHELWVTESLSGAHASTDPALVLYSDLIDHICKGADVERWKSWTSFALTPGQEWARGFGGNIFDIRQRLQAALWPGRFPELEASMKCFADALFEAYDLFSEHCEPDGDSIRGVRFYKIERWDPVLYHRLHDDYRRWAIACDQLIREATRALNWFADCVRRDINPSFFLFQGKFLLVEGPHSDLSYRSALCEYSTEERARLPDAAMERIQKIVADAKKEDVASQPEAATEQPH